MGYSKTYEHYVAGILTSIKKPSVIIPTIGIIELSNMQLSILLLFGLLIADWGTGVYAAWINYKKENGKGFFKYSEKGFSSRIWKQSVTKTITYFLFILLTYAIEHIFQIKSFISDYSDLKITITLFAIAISCGIEFYSIFCENLPKAGFSLEDKFMKAFNKVKSIFTKVKNFKDGQVD